MSLSHRWAKTSEESPRNRRQRRWPNRQRDHTDPASPKRTRQVKGAFKSLEQSLSLVREEEALQTAHGTGSPGIGGTRISPCFRDKADAYTSLSLNKV